MTVEEVLNRVDEIRRNAPDDEKAHDLEDALYRDVLQYFADNGYRIAAEALETQKIEFARWCA